MSKEDLSIVKMLFPLQFALSTSLALAIAIYMQSFCYFYMLTILTVLNNHYRYYSRYNKEPTQKLYNNSLQFIKNKASIFLSTAIGMIFNSSFNMANFISISTCLLL